MRFRLQAFGLHLLASATVLTLVLGSLYAGWYRSPGWYLSDALNVVVMLAGVDLALGPLLTAVVAQPGKPRRTLRRDIAIIVAVQLCALAYGTFSLWQGRPLYYAFSENVLQLVQAYDINADDLKVARAQRTPLLPHWYSLPRWIWAPLPQDPQERARIVGSAISGGDDVISLPSHYLPWQQGLPMLRAQLKKVDEVAYFSPKQKRGLAVSMRLAGMLPDQPNAIPLTGRGKPMLAVFDPIRLQLRAYCRFTRGDPSAAHCQSMGPGPP